MQKEDLRILSKATEENPVFARLDYYLSPQAAKYENFEGPYDKGVLTAVTGAYRDYDVGVMVKGVVLEKGEFKENPLTYRGFERNDISHNPADTIECEILETTDELMKSYNDVLETRKSAPIKVQGSLCEEIPSYMGWDNEKRFPQYEAIEATRNEWTVPIGTELSDGTTIQSIDDIEKWVLENHPAYLMGYSAFVQVPSGDFKMTSVPSPEYPVGYYESYDDRMEYAKMRADKLGVTLGSETALEVLNNLSEPDGFDFDDDDIFGNDGYDDEMDDPAWDDIPDDIPVSPFHMPEAAPEIGNDEEQPEY